MMEATPQSPEAEYLFPESGYLRFLDIHSAQIDHEDGTQSVRGKESSFTTHALRSYVIKKGHHDLILGEDYPPDHLESQDDLLVHYKKMIDYFNMMAKMTNRALILGFSVYGGPGDFKLTYPLMQYAKSLGPHVFTALGGAFFRATTPEIVQRVLAYSQADLGSVGGGKETLDCLIEIARGQKRVMRNEDGIIQPVGFEWPKNCFTPQSDWTSPVHYGSNIDTPPYYDAMHHSIYFSVSPGCPHDCLFCQFESPREGKDPAQVVAEMKEEARYVIDRTDPINLENVDSNAMTMERKRRMDTVLRAFPQEERGRVTVFEDIYALQTPKGVKAAFEFAQKHQNLRISWGRDVVRAERDNDFIGSREKGIMLTQEQMDRMGEGLKELAIMIKEADLKIHQAVSYIWAPTSSLDVLCAKLEEGEFFRRIDPEKIDISHQPLVPKPGENIAQEYKDHFIPRDEKARILVENGYERNVSSWGAGFENSRYLDFYHLLGALGVGGGFEILFFRVLEGEEQLYTMYPDDDILHHYLKELEVSQTNGESIERAMAAVITCTIMYLADLSEHPDFGRVKAKEGYQGTRKYLEAILAREKYLIEQSNQYVPRAGYVEFLGNVVALFQRAETGITESGREGVTRALTGE